MTKQTLIETLMINGGITQEEAARVERTYRKLKVVTFNAHDGFQVKHGGFFDREVIRRAVDSLS